MKKWRFVFLISAGIVILDQLTKLAIVRSFKLYESVGVISGFFSITYLRNKGAAFSFLANSDSRFVLPFFIITTIAAIAVILYLISEEGDYHPLYIPSLSMVLGGALGNFFDRIFRGEVVDFLDFYIEGHHWPAFNTADSSITIGAVLLAFSIFKIKKV